MFVYCCIILSILSVFYLCIFFVCFLYIHVHVLAYVSISLNIIVHLCILSVYCLCILLYIFVYFLYILVYSIGEIPVAVSEVKEETPPTDRGSGHLDIQRLLSQLKSGHRKPPLPLHFDGPKPTASPREGNITLVSLII